MQTLILKTIKPWLVIVFFIMILLTAPGLIYAGEESEAVSSSDTESSVENPPAKDEAVQASSTTTTEPDIEYEMETETNIEAEEPELKETIPDDEASMETEQESAPVKAEDEDAEPAEEIKAPASGGNSYKAEISADGDDATTGMNQDVDLTVTFTELGNTEPLGSARIYLDNNFNYADYKR